MKWLLTCLAACMAGTGMAQPCDYSPKSYAVRSELRIPYGTARSFNGGTDSLFIDIYKPVGDQRFPRPVILFVHGGGFSGGNYKDLTNQAIDFASRGYVAATATYRLGFFRPQAPNSYPYALDKAEPERAAYRAMQDIKGAVRYLKGRYQQDSSDTENVFLAGFSAGAITCLAVAYTQDAGFKLSSCDSISSVVFQGNTYKRPDLGDVQGSLHLNGQNSRVKGVLNYFGGVWDTTVLSANGPAVFSYHQLNDPVVPSGVNRPYFGIGLGISDNYPMIWGSITLDKKLRALGLSGRRIRTYIHNGSAHSVHQPAMLDTMTANWMSALICEKQTNSRVVSGQPLIRRITSPDGDFITASEPVQYVLYDLSGRKTAAGNLEPSGHLPVPDRSCVIRYVSKSGSGAFICTP